MKLDEFAFVNQQLAGMLRSGIPLEGALQQLCATMARGELRGELEALRTDLATGTPLPAALAKRRLPPFYVQMLRVGVASNDLPGVLTLVAEYYQHSHSIWTRLKGVMVYPVIVVVVSLVVSAILAAMFSWVQQGFIDIFRDLLEGKELPMMTGLFVRYGTWLLWCPSLLVIGLGTLLAGLLARPASRDWLRWRCPGYREASLWQVASSLELLVRGGCPLPDALGLVEQMETDPVARAKLASWRQQIAAGKPVLAALTAPSRRFPPLFGWLIASGGEDLPAGLCRAVEIYRARAEYRIELLLHAALPVSVLVLGLLVAAQVFVVGQMVVANFLPLIQVSGTMGG